MKVNIYYGGRGVIDDPTIYVINKMQEVLEELRVEVTRYNLYEQKNAIATLTQTLKEADGIILASTVEWYGVGGYMFQFLDACWQYADKEKISTMYMQPVVMSTTYGEREGKLTLEAAWDLLGGLPCEGVCGYVEDLVSFEINKEYTAIIEKKAENLYRSISQKIKCMPGSNQAVRQSVLKSNRIDLTPQESEQLSNYASDDSFIKKQKEDIEELALMFKSKLGQEVADDDTKFLNALRKSFHPVPDFVAAYMFIIDDKNKNLIVKVNENDMECYFGPAEEDIDVISKLNVTAFDKIISGNQTFQGAFMGGVMTAKGNFRILKTLDKLFVF
ncbi:MAG: SCP-2 sterol transfer family protein [Lachnospiraceae bacterium]|nr:SCP-2 sterol transfer family protein [Lachnospiraceae bacterium]